MTIVAATRRAPEPDEPELIRRVRDGDRASFERLYRLHAGRTYALCLRLTGRREAAEEMTQEVFVRAWQHRRKFRPEEGIGGWLHRVALNLHLGELRKHVRRGVHCELPDDDRLPGPDSSHTAGAELDLERAIAKLPDTARTVYVLHEVHGYQHREIARRTGMAVGTTKTHVHRARQRLKRMLER